MALAVTLLGSAACTRSPAPADSTAGTTTSMSSTGETTTDADVDTDTSTTLDTGDTTDDGDTMPGSFYAGPADIGAPLPCSPWEQDCPEGEKCVPYASTGEDFDSNKCVPVLGDGEPGEPCNYGGRVEATDDCGANSYCWAGADTGICYEFCDGDARDFQCGPELECVIDDAGVFTLCLPMCNPIEQDCDSGFGCYLMNKESLGFACAPTTENIELGEPCDAVNDCAVGLNCVPADTMPDCAGDSCCASFCHLAMPTCPQPNTECTPIIEEGTSPGGEWEYWALCTLPKP